MLDDEEIELIEDDSLDETNASLSNSNYQNFSSSNSKKNSDNLNNAIEKSKQNPGNLVANNINKSNDVTAKSGVDNGNQFKNAGNVANISKGLSSDDPEANKEAGKTLTKDAIKPIARNAVRAVSGGIVPGKIVDPIVDKAVDKMADSDQGEKVIEEATKKVKKAKQKIIIPIIGSVVSSLIPFILIIVIVTAPVLAVNDFMNWLKDAAVNILDFLTWNGVCTTDACKETYENRFYTVVEKYSESYEADCGIAMDTDLITATIFYEQMVTVGDNGSADDDNNRYDYGVAHGEFMKLSAVLYPDYFVDHSENNNLWSSLISNLNPFETFYENFRTLEIVLSDDEKKCPADYEEYANYIDQHYINEKYTKLKKGDYANYTNEDIVADVMSFSVGHAVGGDTDEEDDSNVEDSTPHTTGQTIISMGPGGAIPQEILEVSQSPLGDQQTTQTSCYGYYSTSNCTAHSGVDLVSNSTNPEIYSIADGIVTSVTKSAVHCVPDWKNGKACSVCANSAGNAVTIKHTLEVNGQTITFYSKYFHLNTVSVNYNQTVSKGEVIATMGNTGCSTGRHLHFTMLDGNSKQYNPEELMKYVGLTVKSGCEEARDKCG